MTETFSGVNQNIKGEDKVDSKSNWNFKDLISVTLLSE